MGWPLVGRGRELELLDRVVAASGSVIVTGGIGVGKSRLVVDFLDRLNRSGRQTVLVRATRSTATIPFGPFAPWALDRARQASVERLQVLQGISHAVLDGSDTVVVAVDDGHLLDDGSAALVLHLAAHTPASVVVTVRSDQRCPDAVISLWKESLAERLELQPLSESETIELSEHALGGATAPATRRRLWALSEGVPLYLREVLHAATTNDVLVRSGGVWHWRGALAQSGRLGDLVGDRLASIDVEDRRVLGLVAVGEPLPLDLVVELDDVAALAELEQRGLVMIDCVADPILRLAHPLYGELLRAEMSELTRREHQRALAAAALAVGWQDRDPLRVASWCLEGGSVAGGVGVFYTGARRAPALAEWTWAERLGRAAHASGAGAPATVARATALVHCGRWDEANGLLADLDPDGLDDELTVEWARIRAGFLFWNEGQLAAGQDVLVQAAHRLPASARVRALSEAADLAVFSCEPARAARLAAKAISDAGPVTELRVPALGAAALAGLGQGQISAALGAAEEALPFVAEAVAADPYVGNSALDVTPAYCLALVFDGRLDAAAAHAEEAMELVERNDTWMVVRVLAASLAGRIALFQGRLNLAQQHAGAAVPMLDAVAVQGQWVAAIVATGAAQVGDAARAEEALASAATAGPPIPLYQHELTLARAWLAATKGGLCEARALAKRAATEASRTGAWLLEMLALLDLARLGDPASARGRLTELSHTIDGPYGVAAAAYARAAASEDGESLDTISTSFEAMGALLLAAEAAAGAALAHRAAGRRSSYLASHSRAQTLAAICDCACTPALRSLEAEPILATLTRREREVIELAARSLSNREIANRLYVSIRTVNAHLSHAYAKLGTSDRSQLAALLPTTGPYRHGLG